MLSRLLPPFFVAAFALSHPLCAERTDAVLSDSWRFYKGDAADAEKAAFDDSAWKEVSVPHTWNYLGEPKSGTARYYRGPGWYRRTLDLPALRSGDRYFLRFEAASLVADVYFNGQKLNQHRGGFTAFVYEITDAMKPGKNELAVRVDNTRFDDIAPLSGDFTVFGGLYRPVHLLKTGALCIDPTIDGAPGVAVSQSHVSRASAKVEVTTALSDKRANKSAAAAVRTTIIDAAGKAVARQLTPIPAGQNSIIQNFLLKFPHLWDGVADPYLYAVRVDLVTGNEVLDSIIQPLGLRTITFDKESGLTLNGHPYRLHGVARHQDHGDDGWAISQADQDEDMAIIREIGANAVRLAHYPHSDYFYGLCDKYGILAWTEIPNVNEIRDTPAFAENARQQLCELIRQQGNHPAIFAWGLWNELAFNAEPTPLITALKEEAHQLDPTRPTTSAANRPSRKNFPKVCSVTDILALNIYPGWYEGKPGDMGAILRDFHQFAADQPLGISEYGAGANPNQHEQNRTARPNPTGPGHPEEWQATVHEEAWKEIAKAPFVWGSFVWNLFDFASTGRHEGGQSNINDKGLVTRDRKIKKDAFFFYQATWSEKPLVYITSRRDILRVTPDTPVKIYSNGASVNLKLNGKSLPGDTVDGVIHHWPNVTLERGKNVLEASATFAGRTLTDRVIWTYDPDAKPPK